MAATSNFMEQLQSYRERCIGRQYDTASRGCSKDSAFSGLGRAVGGKF